jgi:hypothetical protein
MHSEPEDVMTSNEEYAAYADTSVGRDVTLTALRRLEAAAGRAGTGRETDWLEQVAADLNVLERAVAAERHEASQPDSLLSMIARDYPRRFSSRIRHLREQHEDVAQTIASLRTQLQSMRDEPIVDVADLRQRLSWLANAIRDRWGRETDLVYEAIRLDLGRADHSAQESES